MTDTEFEKTVFEVCSNAVHLAFMKAAILLPFEEAIATTVTITTTTVTENVVNSTMRQAGMINHFL
jgi:hypothetical protein